jgi:hypothetical protein
MLPRAARPGLEAQLGWRAALHQRDLARGLGWACLPDALDVKYPQAPTALGWPFVFASRQLSRDPRGGHTGRHHLHEGRLHLAVATAVRPLGWTKRATCHALGVPYRSSAAASGNWRGHSPRYVTLRTRRSVASA